jgi:hypothetical protein
MPYVAKSFVSQRIKDSDKELHKYLLRNLCKVLQKIFIAFLLEIRKLLVYILEKGLRKYSGQHAARVPHVVTVPRKYRGIKHAVSWSKALKLVWVLEVRKRMKRKQSH